MLPLASSCLQTILQLVALISLAKSSSISHRGSCNVARKLRQNRRSIQGQNPCQRLFKVTANRTTNIHENCINSDAKFLSVSALKDVSIYQRVPHQLPLKSQTGWWKAYINFSLIMIGFKMLIYVYVWIINWCMYRRNKRNSHHCFSSKITFLPTVKPV